MEILSTGEKIKRARIYKGFTLKDLCDDKISVSKMSCIENGKVYPEDWILGFISEKLGLEVNYLKQNVHDQLVSNIKIIKSNNVTAFDGELLYNIETAEGNCEYDLAFDFMSILYEHFIDIRKLGKIKELKCRYYDLLQKSYSTSHYVTYCMNLGRYLYFSEEYTQALNYFYMVEENTTEEDIELKTRAIYYETVCYLKCNAYDKAYNKATSTLKYVPALEDSFRKAKVYHMVALVSIGNNSNNFIKYEKKAEECFGKDNLSKASALLNYAREFFRVGDIVEGTKYTIASQELYPKKDKEKYVDFMLINVKLLLDNNIYDAAENILDEVLNSAINLNNLSFIEKAYYYKAIICEKDNNFNSAEMFMSLSLDALFKIGTKKDIYKRYLEMGSMYFKMKNNEDSIKYFNLAVNISKKL